MRIRLSVTLDVRREPAVGPDQRETALDATVERSDDRPDYPRIGFTSRPEERA